jgi:restriction endonuclease Mrr
LHSLPYPAFLDAIAALMDRAGYYDAAVLRRGTDRNSDGGVDLLANAVAGLGSVGIVVQAKQYAEPVQKRYVDEIRGAAVRYAASHAVIFSTSAFSNAACDAASKGASVPVILVDRSKLADLMAWHRIGVVRTKDGLAIDPAFFEGVASRHKEALNRLDSLDANHKRSLLTVNLWFGDRTSSSESPRCGS